jgi:hypothetical protein
MGSSSGIEPRKAWRRLGSARRTVDARHAHLKRERAPRVRELIGVTATLRSDEIETWPHITGGTNWFPYSFNPRTGLAYVNTADYGMKYKPDPIEAGTSNPASPIVL